MATMTKLFEKVSANDWEWIEQLTHSQKEVNWNCIRFRLSLVHRAIEVRALKTFDILMTIPQLTVFTNSSGFVNGMSKALEYYAEAPNQENAHYLHKLLEKNVYVDPYLLSQYIDKEWIYDLLFSRLKKTDIELKLLLEKAIRINNILIIQKIYEYMETNDNTIATFYSPENRIAFNNVIFSYMLQSIHNTKTTLRNSIIEFLISKNICWKTINNIPTLYHVALSGNEIIFNYFLAMYKNLSEDELNNIPNIRNLANLFGNNSCVTDNMLKSILKLPINFNDMSIHIIDIYKNIYTTYHYYSYVTDSIVTRFTKMFILLTEKKVRTNPYSHLLNNFTQITQYIEYTKNRTDYKDYQLFMRIFIHIMDHFGYIMPESIKLIYNFCFENKNINYTDEKMDIINKLKSQTYPVPKAPTKIKPKPKSKKSPKKDIEI